MEKPKVCKVSIADFSACARSPVLAICQVSERGVIFTATESFEVGDSIQLGFHVRYHGGEETGPVHRSEFINCEGSVVGCILCAGPDGVPVYEVTLLFSCFPEGDSGALRRFADLEGLRRASGSGGAKPDPVGGTSPDLALGLN